MSDEDLDAIAGGKKSKRPDAKYHVGQRVVAHHEWRYQDGTIASVEYSEYQGGWYYLINFDSGSTFEYPESWIKPI